MSSSSVEQRAVIEAIVACERLARELTELIARHEHAASVARPDWTGPHRATFEERVAAVQRNLAAGQVWVLRVLHEAEAKLEALQAEAALLRTTGLR
jgi:plasmid stabilization system protein ParE